MEVYIKADPKDAIYEYWLPVVKNLAWEAAICRGIEGKMAYSIPFLYIKKASGY